MPTFTVRTIDGRGRARTVRRAGRDEHEIEKALETEGLLVTRVVATADEAPRRAARGRLSGRALLDFTERLQILYESGVPLAEALREIETASGDAALNRIAAAIRRDLEDGRPLADSLERFPRAFPSHFRAAVKAGEASGALDEVLPALSEQITWERTVRSTVSQAFIYPAFLLSAVLGLLVFLFTFLLPRLVAIFEKSRVELPAPTRIVMAVSAFLQQHGVVLLAGLGVLVIGFVAARRTPRGRVLSDRLLLALPGFGPLAKKVAAARFAGTLRMLHRSGTPMTRALELCRSAVRNAAVAKDLEEVQRQVVAGTSLTEALSAAGAVESTVTRMIAVGERSGALTAALDRASAYYDREVKTVTRRLLAMLEPMILIFSGVAVGFVIFATLLPVFRLFGALAK